MRKRICFLLLLLLGGVMAPTFVFGSGFAINEQGTKAIGMGGAFVAQADDPSAVYYNPAGIVQLKGTQASGGLATISPNVTFKSNQTDTTLNTFAGKTTDPEQTFFVPNAYVAHSYNEHISVGFGRFSNFDLETDYPDDWEGRYLTGGTNASLLTTTHNPVIAYKVHKRLSLGAGFALQYLDLGIENKINAGALVPGEDDASFRIKEDNWSEGWNVGLLFWITDDIKLGGSYRSKIRHKYDDILEVTGFTHPALLTQNTKEKAKVSLTLPAIASIGIAWSTGPVTLELDGQHTDWSAYELKANYVYSRIDPLESKGWKNVWAVRFGANYKVNELFDIRAGIVWDESPIPNDALNVIAPSGDRWVYTLGAAFHHKNMTIDCAYNYLDDSDRKFNNETGDSKMDPVSNPRVTGEFEDINAHIFMLNFSYQF